MIVCPFIAEALLILSPLVDFCWINKKYILGKIRFSEIFILCFLALALFLNWKISLIQYCNFP